MIGLQEQKHKKMLENIKKMLENIKKNAGKHTDAYEKWWIT